MSSATIKISLPEGLQDHVQKHMAEGGFRNPGDFVHALIQLDKQRQEKRSALRDAIAIGIDQLDRGKGVDGEEVFLELLDEPHR